MLHSMILAVFSMLSTLSGYQGSVPDFRLQNTDNQLVTYKEIKGEQLTVIDFWATWCKPCVKSIPGLIELHESLEASGVRFVGISVDSPRNLSKVKPFTRSMGITYPVLLDSNAELMGELNVTAIPTLLIIDDQDRIVYTHEGFRTGDKEVIRKEIEKQLSPDEE